MHNEASIEINRPIDVVYRLTTEHVAEWSLTVVDDEVLHEVPGGVGTTFLTVTEERGKRMEFAGIVTECDPPRVHASFLAGAGFDIDVRYLFEDLGDRTRVTQVSDVEGKGLIGLMLKYLGWMMKQSSHQAAQKELASLKQFCETHNDAANT